MSSVTIEQVNEAIKSETYTVLPDGRTTICQLTLDNGFTVDGKSACVSIENFNVELGNKYSREDAVNKVWAFLGFRLADKLANEALQELSDLSQELGLYDNCKLPPEGWACTRKAGHTGPCAAYSTSDKNILK